MIEWLIVQLKKQTRIKNKIGYEDARPKTFREPGELLKL